MENWLARSNMNVQRPSLTEKRDAQHLPHLGCTSNAARVAPRLQVYGGRRNTRRHEAYASLSEQFEDFHDLQRPSSAVSIYESEQWAATVCEGFVYSSSQLQLFPGSLKIIEAVNEDAHPTWDLVAQVVYTIEESINCPICLYPPVAPRIERCGHVYCGPCAAQYIGYENTGETKKCAVCSWIISLEDMKRVTLLHVSAVDIGSELEMVLVERCQTHKNAFRLAPYLSGTVSTTSAFQFVAEISHEDMTLCDECDVASLEAYKVASIEDGNTEILPYITYITDRLIHNINQKASNPEKNLRTFSTPITETHNLETCFYQASDGQLIFLDGLMWKCLLEEYNEVGRLPNPLKVIVRAIRKHKMTEASRKRWRYLNHLPLGRTISFIEIELASLVSRSTLVKFSAALDIRSLELTRRRIEDMRLTRLKEAAENRIPSLPEGFKLSGHAQLLDHPISTPQVSDFMPLCMTPSATSKLSSPSASFAEVTKLGALSVVDHNRVATFARASSRLTVQPPFNPVTEIWPSLSDTPDSKDISSPSSPSTSLCWRHSSAVPNTELLNQNNEGFQVSEPRNHAKRNRRRRKQNNSSFESPSS